MRLEGSGVGAGAAVGTGLGAEVGLEGTMGVFGLGGVGREVVREGSGGTGGRLDAGMAERA